MQNNFYVSISKLTCIIFAHIVLVLNTLCALIVAPHMLAPLYSIYLILFISAILSAITVLIKNKLPKVLSLPTYCNAMMIFSLGSIFLNTFVVIFRANFVWNIYSVYLLLVFSALVSACFKYLKFKSIGISFLFYFFAIGMFYYILSIAIAGFGVGSKLVVVIFSYVIIYLIVMIAILIIRGRIKAKKLNKQKYQKKF
jgi:hypothetical protein